MHLTYDTGEKNIIKLAGTAEDADIRLEMHTLPLNNAYISLHTSTTLKIHNRSEIMAKFCWKMFATDSEENSYRNRKLLEQEMADQAEDTAFMLV